MELLIIIAVLCVLAAAGPLGFADGPAGDIGTADAGGGEPDSSSFVDAPSGGGVGDEPAPPSVGDGDEDGSSQAARPAQPESLRDLTAKALRRAEADVAGIPPTRAPADRDPNTPPAPPPASAALAAFAPDEAAWQGVAPEQRAVLEPVLNQILDRVYADRYVPAAQAVWGEYQRLAKWYESASRTLSGPAGQLATWLEQHPETYERVVATLNGQPDPGAAQQPQQPALNLDELDPDMRRVYETMRAESQTLAAGLRDAQSRLSAYEAQRQEEQQRQRAAQVAAATEAVTGDVGAALQAASKRLGFDPTRRTDLWPRAMRHMQRVVTAEGPPRNSQDMQSLLDEALDVAGYGKVLAARAQQRRSSDSPPPAGGQSGKRSLIEETRAARMRAEAETAGSGKG